MFLHHIFCLEPRPPSLIIGNDADGIAKGDITFDFKFSEPVSFMEEDIKVKGGEGSKFSGSDTSTHM